MMEILKGIWNGDSDPQKFINGKAYEILDVYFTELKLRVIDETGRESWYPAEDFEIFEEKEDEPKDLNAEADYTCEEHDEKNEQDENDKALEYFLARKAKDEEGGWKYVQPGEPYLCPVCGKYTFEEADSFDICEVCGWEDDLIQLENPDDYIGANEMSLNNYRKAYESGWRPKWLSHDEDEDALDN